MSMQRQSIAESRLGMYVGERAGTSGSSVDCPVKWCWAQNENSENLRIKVHGSQRCALLLAFGDGISISFILAVQPTDFIKGCKLASKNEISSRQEASNGQRFPCPALLYFLFLFLVYSMEAGQRPR